MTLDDPSRIWFGTDESPPGPGMVLVLNHHHDGESHWCSPKQALARIEYIVNGHKPEYEWGPRMEAMKIVSYGKWWDANAISEANAVRDKAVSEANAVRDKAVSEANAVRDKAVSEADAVRDKAWSEANAVWNKACSEAEVVWDKAYSEANAVRDKAVSEIASKAPEMYPAEAWAAEYKEKGK